MDAADVVITRGKGKKSFVTGNHISLNIRPGELVAVVGGSGAGKSTILNCLCGYLPPDTGEVFINGSSLYQNFDSLKKLIGYVPQSDIVYDNLTLYDMLSYTCLLYTSAFPRTLFCRDCGGRGAAAAERKAPSGPHTGGIRGSHRKGKSAFRI